MEKFTAEEFSRAFGPPIGSVCGGGGASGVGGGCYEPQIAPGCSGNGCRPVKITDSAKHVIESILSKGNDVEIRAKKDGIQIIEVKKSTKYST